MIDCLPWLQKSAGLIRIFQGSAAVVMITAVGTIAHLLSPELGEDYVRKLCRSERFYVIACK